MDGEMASRIRLPSYIRPSADLIGPVLNAAKSRVYGVSESSQRESVKYT
jgi:hypothetical protein